MSLIEGDLETAQPYHSLIMSNRITGTTKPYTNQNFALDYKLTCLTGSGFFWRVGLIAVQFASLAPLLYFCRAGYLMFLVFGETAYANDCFCMLLRDPTRLNFARKDEMQILINLLISFDTKIHR